MEEYGRQAQDHLFLSLSLFTGRSQPRQTGAICTFVGIPREISIDNDGVGRIYVLPGVSSTKKHTQPSQTKILLIFVAKISPACISKAQRGRLRDFELVCGGEVVEAERKWWGDEQAKRARRSKLGLRFDNRLDKIMSRTMEFCSWRPEARKRRRRGTKGQASNPP